MSKLELTTPAIKAILFDLDGTLLRVPMAEFIPLYVDGLASCCSDLVKPKKFQKMMLAAIRSLFQAGDGAMTNEQRVFSFLHHQLAIPEPVLKQRFERYRLEGLESLKGLIKPIPLAMEILKECRAAGIPLVLATNPVFPAFMIDARLAWGELERSMFSHLTSFENSCFCKPHAGYFREISELLGVAAEHCLMVGNDPNQDMAAVAIGMQTFLVDTWIVSRQGTEWPCLHRGDHATLQRFLRKALLQK